MKAKIGVISPYPGFSETVEQVAAELKMDVIIRGESESDSDTEIQEWVSRKDFGLEGGADR